LTKYLDIFFHHLIGFALIMLMLPAGLSVLFIMLFPTAQAGGSLWVTDPAYLGVAATQTSNWNQYLTPAQNASDIMTQIVATEAFQKQVSAKLDSSNVWRSAQERTDTLSTFPTSMKVTVTGSHLVTLTITCPRADLCVQVLQTAISVYKDTLDQQQQQQAKAASGFYTAQLQQAQAALRNDQGALDVYLLNHPSVRVSPTTKTTDLPADYVQLSQRVTSDQATIQTLQSKLGDASFNSSAANEVNNSAIRIVDKPTAFPAGMLSSLPKKQLAIAWGGCLGLGLAILLLLGWLDRTAGEPRDLEKALNVAVVAKIPLMKSGTRLQ
jgi:uncharacterized protein involved in exopolysaccharide biosynthesis